MPSVRLEFEDGRNWSDSGGCFGFAGRHGRCTSIQTTATRFIYRIGASFDNTRHLNDMMRKPIADYLTWLTTSSPWSKYFETHSYTPDSINTRTEVAIDPDNEGHAVIGCASLARLAYHRPAIIKVMSELVQEGCDPTLALLVCYSFLGGLQLSSNPNELRTYYLSTNGLSGSLSMGDDEPMVLNRLDAGTLYSMISGTFQFKEDPEGRKYKDTLVYSQNILRSYQVLPQSRETKGFTGYLKSRCINVVTSNIVFTNNGGMGTRRTRRPNVQSISSDRIMLNTYEVKGLAHTLNKELKQYGKFLGFGKDWEFVA